jgi:hypothetical protein
MKRELSCGGGDGGRGVSFAFATAFATALICNGNAVTFLFGIRLGAAFLEGHRGELDPELPHAPTLGLRERLGLEIRDALGRALPDALTLGLRLEIRDALGRALPDALTLGLRERWVDRVGDSQTPLALNCA